jgi:hypothetical protein
MLSKSAQCTKSSRREPRSLSALHAPRLDICTDSTRPLMDTVQAVTNVRKSGVCWKTLSPHIHILPMSEELHKRLEVFCAFTRQCSKTGGGAKERLGNLHCRHVASSKKSEDGMVPQDRNWREGIWQIHVLDFVCGAESRQRTTSCLEHTPDFLAFVVANTSSFSCVYCTTSKLCENVHSKR